MIALDRPAARSLQAAIIAALAFILANAWVAARLDTLLEGTFVRQYVALDARVVGHAAPEQVKVLLVGNSHVHMGLVPPHVADALGLRPEEVFSLAMPATTPLHTRLLLDRHLARFPGVRLVLCGLDTRFVSTDVELASRYLTRWSPGERFHYARRYGGPWQQQLALVASRPFPVAEYGPLLRKIIVQRRGIPVRRLLPGFPTGADDRLRTAFPWGFPVDMRNWPPKPARYWRLARPRRAAYDAERAEGFVGRPDVIGAGLDELDAIVAGLTARGISTAFVEVPFDAGFTAVLATQPGYPALHARVRRHVEGLAPVMAPTPGWAGERYFFDDTHLNLVGARSLARLVGAELRRRGLDAPLRGS
jgi:hypothetical protein